MLSVHRMGCSIGKWCWKFNPKNRNYEKIIQPTVVKLKLKITVKQIVNPRPNDKYSLLLFSSRDVQQTDHLNRYIEIPTNNNSCWDEFCCPIDPRLPDFLHVWLFVTNTDQDKVTTQTLLASGRVDFIELIHFTHGAEIVLTDILNTKQAMIQIQISNRTKKLTTAHIHQSNAFSKLEKFKELSNYYTTLVNERYEQFTYQHNQKFVYMDSHMGRLPLLAAPLLASTVKANREDAIRLFDHFAAISCMSMGIQYEAVHAMSQAIQLELIGEILTLISRCIVYQNDTVRANKQSDISTDQWATLNIWPDLSLAGFDCEDAANQILELFTIFKHIQITTAASPEKNNNSYSDDDSLVDQDNNSKYSNLIVLQQLLQHYTAFLCLGILNLSTGVTPHAYVVLLDSNYVNAQFFPKSSSSSSSIPNSYYYYPALTLEGTTYTESLWLAQQTRAPADYARYSQNIAENFLVNSELALNHSNPDHYTRLVKYKMPNKDIRSSKLYGNVTALLTGNHTTADGKRVAMHVLTGVEEEKSFLVGLPLESLMHYNTVHIQHLLILKDEEIAPFESLLLSEFPHSSFPKTPRNKPLGPLRVSNRWVRKTDTAQFSFRQKGSDFALCMTGKNTTLTITTC